MPPKDRYFSHECDVKILTLFLNLGILSFFRPEILARRYQLFPQHTHILLFEVDRANDQVSIEKTIMAHQKKDPKPRKSDLLPESLQENPTLPPNRAPKRIKFVSEPHSNLSGRSTVTPEPTEKGEDATFSPGHASGYIQWKRAPVPDLMTETEEEKRSRINKKHAPKGKRGTRCINDGTVDRKPAILGKPDPSKLFVDFNTEESDEHTNEVIRGEIRYEYGVDEKGHKVDWNNLDFIQHLNNWRSQVIRRNIGKAYDKNEFWTVEEQKVVTKIIADFLNAGKDIDWLQIAHEYNSLVRNTKQEKGAPGAPRRYYCQENHKPTREAISISIPLPEDREIPARTDWVLRREMGYFLAPDAIAVMEKLKACTRCQLNGNPQKKLTRKEKLAKMSEEKAAVREYSEEDGSLASSMYGNNRYLVESRPESTLDPQKGLLTKPRPLLPRSTALNKPTAMPVTSPLARGYKRRTAYDEEIAYDMPDTTSFLPTSFNTIPLIGGSQKALDTLAEQAAIMYDQLPESQKWSAPRPVVTTPIGLRQALAAPGPSRSVSFGPKSTSPADGSNTFSSSRTTPSRTQFSGSMRETPLPPGLGHQSSSPEA
ncbi:hypothetical protein DSL72_004981 [Monilinia vaccinii-corymbosi]|uniref:Uncharacterized protein n=1 Tax=Monilinia vaccinii-corymbosi TaxID=61207 RepID=A0A8A3PEC2_9HELO|nr:hypothetical protein DSL72_004981 [Monilinia vaccinii-corymbosi]